MYHRIMLFGRDLGRSCPNPSHSRGVYLEQESLVLDMVLASHLVAKGESSPSLASGFLKTYLK